MASPHASGVAALAVSAHGHQDGTARPHLVARQGQVVDVSNRHRPRLPPGGVQEYLQEGRDAEFTATCVGTPEFNGFYGAGIVNALGVVQ